MPRDELLIVLGLTAAFALAALASPDPVAVERDTLSALDAAVCRARGGMPLMSIDGPLACVDSATLVALPPPLPEPTDSSTTTGDRRPR